MISAGYFTPNEIRVRNGFAPLRDDDGRFGTLHWYAADSHWMTGDELRAVAIHSASNLTDEAKVALREKWFAMHNGANFHKPIILEEPMRYYAYPSRRNGKTESAMELLLARIECRPSFSNCIAYTLPEPIRWSRLIIFGTAIALLASALAAYLK